MLAKYLSSFKILHVVCDKQQKKNEKNIDKYTKQIRIPIK